MVGVNTYWRRMGAEGTHKGGGRSMITLFVYEWCMGKEMPRDNTFNITGSGA